MVKIFIGALASSCLSRLIVATCELPFQLPEGARPLAAAVGIQGSIVIGGDHGLLLFGQLDDFAVREDTYLRDKYTKPLGRLDIQGIAKTNPGSTYLYFGLESTSTILEYEYHSSHRVFRQFELDRFESSDYGGLQCMTWVPTAASQHQGFFYVGSKVLGRVFIYELPLLDNSGPKAMAKLVKMWFPVEDDKHIAGLAHCSGYIFVSYDNGISTHVLIYPILPSGLPGPLQEQYEVDVDSAKGMAVRQLTRDSWEVLFTSLSHHSVFAYTFRFEFGFELHSHCASLLHKQEAKDKRPWQRGASNRHLLSLSLYLLSLMNACLI
eukprot:TRINITY_DN6141_c0_g1_i1.p1 TRINITY_DN6141_c0_g1~~TRINITY_DN6141_c0_g1_i1.p1  ORF type:complete len:323 (-),score=31.66 TRINITY_DN6141_c0_g1_i1:61-1029(-)